MPSISPPPRRLTRASRKRLRREFSVPLWASVFILAVTVLGSMGRFFAGRGAHDLLLELQRSEGAGRVAYEPREDRSPFIAWFEFKAADEHEYENFSFSNDRTRVPRRGVEVTIEYCPRRPQVSRIAGMRCGLTSWRSFVLPVVMLVIVSPITGLFFRMRRRRRQVCESGKTTTGILVEPTRLESLLCRKRFARGPCAYNSLKYRFEDEFGRPHERWANTRRSPVALEPGHAVTIIYDLDNPKRSIVVEALGLEFAAEEETGSQD